MTFGYKCSHCENYVELGLEPEAETDKYANLIWELKEIKALEGGFCVDCQRLMKVEENQFTKMQDSIKMNALARGIAKFISKKLGFETYRQDGELTELEIFMIKDKGISIGFSGDLVRELIQISVSP